ncbi:MAG: hypothetical protein LBD29_09100, partial [Treponema sp.]|nr:hypothetical protein [Treponema sp.]
KEPNLVLSGPPAPANKIKEDAPLTPIGVNPGIDVWGGKLIYTYKALSYGTISVDLVGGGAGGSGGAAARDYGGGSTRAQAGRSANGGSTKLYLNGTLKETATGGVGVNGADTGVVDGPEWPFRGDGQEVPKNGTRGSNGQEVRNVQITVYSGDIISIEVGYGGGGSGGAAENDAESHLSTGNADKTRGSEGDSRQKSSTVAGASRGGMGAMHEFIFPGNSYPLNLQRGGDSPGTYSTPVASGGQSKGAGGAGGDGYAGGGMYASGGGGGAAGGFTLKSATVAVVEQ